LLVQEDDRTFAEVKPINLRRLPIRRIQFTTPAAERGRLAAEGKALAEKAVATREFAPILAFVSAQLDADPERSDVVHDLLAHLAQQMIDLHKQRQKLETARDPFKWFHRGGGCERFDRVFANAIKYGQRATDPDLTAVRHDVEALELVPLGGDAYELRALLKHRDPASGWARALKDEQGKIVRAWVTAYRFELPADVARFYRHALPIRGDFEGCGRFPGGKTRTTLQKLHAGKIPRFDPSIDLTSLVELDAELADVRGRIMRADALIDQIVYRLYGLNEAEIAVVEGR